MERSFPVYISLGSNLGDRRGNCRKGIEALAAAEGCRVVKQAPCYRTSPVGFAEQDWFVNTVVKAETALAPEALLFRLKAIEADAGRKPAAVRFGPRVLDMDILLFADRIVKAGGLSIPHPRMHERRFVLVPFCDIDPEVVHPVLGLSVRELLRRLNEEEQKVEPCDC